MVGGTLWCSSLYERVIAGIVVTIVIGIIIDSLGSRWDRALAVTSMVISEVRVALCSTIIGRGLSLGLLHRGELEVHQQEHAADE